jgi:hypothetical protein
MRTQIKRQWLLASSTSQVGEGENFQNKYIQTLIGIAVTDFSEGNNEVQKGNDQF